LISRSHDGSARCGSGFYMNVFSVIVVTLPNYRLVTDAEAEAMQQRRLSRRGPEPRVEPSGAVRRA
jgi:hypothetical protein